MKGSGGNSIFPRSPGLEPHYQMQFSVIRKPQDVVES